MVKSDNDLRSFINANATADVAALRLRYAGKKLPFDLDTALTQIECRRKFGKKLASTLAAFPDFRFPSVLSGEQASSDILAAFHASLIPENTDAIDLTAGLGIDAMHMAARAASVIAVERNPQLVEAISYNAQGLHIGNLKAVEGDCREVIETFINDGRHFGIAFIDPARRAADGSRLFALADCEPDIISLMPRLCRLCDRLVIKASPMLDISNVISALTPAPVSVIACGTPSECKELVIVIDTGSSASETIIKAVTLTPAGAEIFSFTRTGELSAGLPEPAHPVKAGDYIFEPSPCVMKAGPFALLAQRYNLNIFTANTRLFYAPSPVEGFPGNTFRIEAVLPYASKVIKRFSRQWPRAEIAVRNFGISAEELRKRLGVNEGGAVRVYGITGPRSERMLLVCAR